MANKYLLTYLRCIKNTDDEQNDVQKWWAMFGRYWLVLNRHVDDDIKLMSWLMNGANHSTVDTCGENVNSFKRFFNSCQSGGKGDIGK